MTRAAFVLGCNGPEKLGRLQRLAFAQSDAARFAEAISAQDVGFSVIGLDIRHRNDVIDVFQDLAATVGTEDELLFYFAGHGVVRHGDLFLILDQTRLDRLPGSALPWVNVKQIIRDSAARDKVVILDCCHAGEAGEDSLGGASLRGGFDENAVKEAVRGSTASILMACGQDGFARETQQLAGGVLTTLIVQALGPKRREAADATGRLSLGLLRNWMWRQIDTLDDFKVARNDRPRLIESGGPSFYLTRRHGVLPARPTVVWKARVGHQMWKNTPLPAGNDVFVGSAGVRWNQPDPGDGIYCLAAENGAVRWIAPTPADTNRVILAQNVVVAGCDDGSVVAVAATNGTLLWSCNFASGIVGGPHALPSVYSTGMSDIGLSLRDRLESPIRTPLLVLTFEGLLCLVEIATGEEIHRLDLHSRAIAGPLVFRHQERTMIVVPSLDGRLIFVEYSDVSQSLSFLHEVTIDFASEYAPSGREIAELGADPVYAQGLVLQGFARNTYYDDPPLIALDAASGEPLWVARDPQPTRGRFGNLRGAPIVIQNQVIFATAYSGELCAVDIGSGELLWGVDVGRAIFEQWSAPVLHGDRIYLGRNDGYLHKVNVTERRREWSIFLGDSERAGALVLGSEPPPDLGAQAVWSAGANAPITATPAFDRGRIFVGTYEGYLYCVADPEEAEEYAGLE